MNNIEVEVRAFITKGQYLKLLKFFKKEGKFIKKDNQVSYYFGSPQDLRIQKSDQSAKIWLKKGKIHQNLREEIELIIDKKDFDQAEELFKALGYKIEIKWYRKRYQFNWRGIKTCIDYTRGYGYIIELEKIISKKNRSYVLKDLRAKLKELGVVETPKKEFDQKFARYKKNWKELIRQPVKGL